VVEIYGQKYSFSFLAHNVEVTSDLNWRQQEIEVRWSATDGDALRSAPARVWCRRVHVCK